MRKSVIVHGPQGCGKTHHAKEIAAHLGLTKILDGWSPGSSVLIPTEDTLILTNVLPPDTGLKVMTYESVTAAMHRVIPFKPRAT